MDSHGTASEVKISVGDNSMSSKRGPLLSLPLESTTTRSRGEACKSGQGTAINLMPFTLGSLNSISSSADRTVRVWRALWRDGSDEKLPLSNGNGDEEETLWS